jgi:hypothetical protein
MITQTNSNNNGSVPIKKIVIHHFNLKDASKALGLAHLYCDNVIIDVFTF